MPMFVHRSNRSEVLVDRLAEILASHAGDPARPVCICVAGRGTERWLAMQLAERLGFFGHAEYPFPRHLLERAFLALGIGPREPKADAWRPEALTWTVASALRTRLGDPAFAPVAAYLRSTDGPVGDARLLELSQRLGVLFDRYVTLRPEMVLGWENGVRPLRDAWQADLWNAVVALAGKDHFAARAQRFMERIGAASALAEFPERVFCFGVSSLPPLYVTLLGALAQRVPVHLFVLSPSREYWGDLRRERASAEPERSHPLLVSLGRVGRDLQRVLEERVDYHEADPDLHREPEGPSALAALQRDLLHLRGRRAGSPNPPVAIPESDASIRVHACHSPMREIEVLHDQLLALLEADRTLQPHHIVVMTPRLEQYAPLVEAVFGRAGDGRAAIPASLSDRPTAAWPALRGLEQALDVLGGRFTANAVLDLLAVPALRARFALETHEVDVLRAWVRGANIRWGLDAAHRQDLGAPALSENTWRFGLDRLLLGLAMPSEGRVTFGGVLPYDHIDGAMGPALGKLLELHDALASLRTRLRAPRAVAQWCRDLDDVLRRLFEEDEHNADQHHLLRERWAEIGAAATAVGFDQPVELNALRPLLVRQLPSPGGARGDPGYLRGGVTFCDLMPMRSLPFRVVGLLGMSDDAFPRAERPMSFDLIAEDPRPGDRTRRDDDRFVFLEALLSARDALIITYVGQSNVDPGLRPPSVVVAELLDALDEGYFVAKAARAAGAARPSSRRRRHADLSTQLAFGFAAASEGAAHVSMRDVVVVRHPLQPFSPRYFGESDDPRLFSYAQVGGDAARTLQGERRPAPHLLGERVRGGYRPSDLDLEALIAILDHPVRAFLRRRLGIDLGEEEPVLEDAEPLVLSPLAKWWVGDQLLRRLLQGHRWEDTWPQVTGSGVMPLGTVGAIAFEDLRPEVEIALGAVLPWVRGDRLPPLFVDQQIAGVRVTGRLDQIWPTGQVHYGFAKLGRRSELGVWVRHLVLNAFAPPGTPRVSRITGRPPADGAGSVVVFDAVADARARLEVLVEIALSAYERPLPFFAQASRRYADKLGRKGPSARVAALRDARETFHRGYWNVPAERDDPYIQHVYAHTDPIAAGDDHLGFEALASAVFEPMLRVRGESR